MHATRSCNLQLGPGRCTWQVARRLPPCIAPRRSSARARSPQGSEGEASNKRAYLRVMFTCVGDCLRSEVMGVVGSDAVLDEWRQGKVSNVLSYYCEPPEYGNDWIGSVYLPEGEKVEFKFALVDRKTRALKAWRNDLNNGSSIALVVKEGNEMGADLSWSAWVLEASRRKFVAPGEDPNQDKRQQQED